MEQVEEVRKTMYCEKLAIHYVPWTMVYGLSSTMDYGSSTMDYGPWTMDYGPWTMDHGLWTMDYGPWTMDHGPWTMDHGPWTMVQFSVFSFQSVRPGGAAHEGHRPGTMHGVFVPTKGGDTPLRQTNGHRNCLSLSKITCLSKTNNVGRKLHAEARPPVVGDYTWREKLQ